MYVSLEKKLFCLAIATYQPSVCLLFPKKHNFKLKWPNLGSEGGCISNNGNILGIELFVTRNHVMNPLMDTMDCSDIHYSLSNLTSYNLLTKNLILPL